MSGDRPDPSDLPTRIDGTSPEATVPQTDGTLVVAHAEGVKSVSSLNVAITGADAESHFSLIGKIIGSYRIRAELGAGGDPVPIVDGRLQSLAEKLPLVARAVAQHPQRDLGGAAEKRVPKRPAPLRAHLDHVARVGVDLQHVGAVDPRVTGAPTFGAPCGNDG